MSDSDLSAVSTIAINNGSALPVNASALEYQLEQAMSSRFSRDNLPVAEITNLWQPEFCSVHLLPWLAWAYGIENWDESWSEQTQRGVIENSFQVHRYQGTRYAIERALQPLGFDCQIQEWFEVNPNASPGTFIIEVDVSQQGITPEVIASIHDLVSSNKRGSAHYSLTMNLSCVIAPKIATTQISSCSVTVQPWYASELLASTSMSVGSSSISLIDITIYPDVYQNVFQEVLEIPVVGLPEIPTILVG